MRKQGPFLTLVFLLAVFFTVQGNLELKDAEDIERIKMIQKGKDIADWFLSRERVEKFTNVAKTALLFAGPIFSVISMVLDIAFSFIKKPDSEELVFMREQFKNINNRFDHVFQEFEDVKREIKWESARGALAEYELSIRAMVVELNIFQNVNKDNEKSVKEHFIRQFDRNYRGSAKKIAQAIIGINVIPDNILHVAMERTQYHRPKVQAFMTGLLDLILTGMQIEATYYKLIDDKLLNVVQKDWETLIKAVKEEMENIDKELEDHWFKQLEKDIPVYTEKHHALGHKEFAESLRTFLEEKFISKDFFVFSYGEMHGFEVHAWKCCACILQLRKSGRNLLVAWAERSSRVYTEKHKENEEVDSHQRSGYLVLKGQAAAYEVLNSFGTTCNERNTLGVVGVNHGGYISSHENRLVYTRINVKVCSTNLKRCLVHEWHEFFVIKTK